MRARSAFRRQSPAVSTLKYRAPRDSRPRFASARAAVAVVEVLQHVVAEDEVEGLLRRVVRDALLQPAVAPAEVGAGLESDVARARKELAHRGPQVAEPAAGVEHALDREAEVVRVGADEAAEAQRVRARGDAGARVDVVALVEARVEQEGTLTYFQSVTRFSPSLRTWIKVSVPFYSTVTLFARLRGWSTSVPFSTAVW